MAIRASGDTLPPHSQQVATRTPQSESERHSVKGSAVRSTRAHAAFSHRAISAGSCGRKQGGQPAPSQTADVYSFAESRAMAITSLRVAAPQSPQQLRGRTMQSREVWQAAT